jgi:hypothetical protein
MAQELLRHAEWLPLREAAELYRVTPDTMRLWLRQGLFTSTYFGAEVWVARSELYDALRRPPRVVPAGGNTAAQSIRAVRRRR